MVVVMVVVVVPVLVGLLFRSKEILPDGGVREAQLERLRGANEAAAREQLERPARPEQLHEPRAAAPTATNANLDVDETNPGRVWAI